VSFHGGAGQVELGAAGETVGPRRSLSTDSPRLGKLGKRNVTERKTVSSARALRLEPGQTESRAAANGAVAPQKQRDQPETAADSSGPARGGAARGAVVPTVTRLRCRNGRGYEEKT